MKINWIKTGFFSYHKCGTCINFNDVYIGHKDDRLFLIFQSMSGYVAKDLLRDDLNRYNMDSLQDAKDVVESWCE